jgi:hypothetical protein
LTASSLNSAVYACLGIFFISSLSKVTSILRHLWKAKFRGKLRLPGLFPRWGDRLRRSLVLPLPIELA